MDLLVRAQKSFSFGLFGFGFFGFGFFKNESLQCAMRILVVFQIIVQYPRDTSQVYTIGPKRGPRHCGAQDL